MEPQIDRRVTHAAQHARGASGVVLTRRNVLRGAALAGVSVVASACSTAAAPAWTFLPPDQQAMTGSAQPSGMAGSGPTVRIVAANFAFDLAEFAVPAETAFQIEFDHRDAGIPHNVAIYDSSADGAVLFRGDIFPGPKVVTYDVPPLPRGRHYFQCDPHPMMNGAVVVS